MATDIRGHTVPTGTGHPARADVLNLGLSVRDPIPVANATARAALITNLASAGITPSTSNPVYTFRADAAAGLQLEVTTDGTTWRTITASSSPAPTMVVRNSAGTVLPAGTAPVIQSFVVQDTSDGSGMITVTFPQAFTVAPIVTATTASGTAVAPVINANYVTATQVKLIWSGVPSTVIRTHIIAIGW